ncbi:MAG: hypothetical protein ACXWXR_09710 [Candidatus Limnocylindrales bacterium]
MAQRRTRLRASIASAILLLGLIGTGSVSAGEPTPTTAASPTISGTGVLVARGDGHVRLGGSYVVTGSLDGGTLRIDGAGVISSVTVTGWISRTRLADGSLIYRFGDSTGHFLIGGRTIVTRIVSHSMQFSAAGHGRAWLIGTGTYWANGHGPFDWTAPAAESTSVPSTTF